MSLYYNVKTNAGDAAIATALANNTKLNITHVVFGDGGGSVPNPSKNRTSLINEVHRQAVSKYTQHPTVSKWLTIETIIPSNTGGFWIREIGIIADGVLISHGSHAPFFKVADMEGVSEYRLKFTIDIQDASIVQLTLDESLIYATQAWVNENYVPRADIIDNLTTADATKPLSAAQGKALQDSKLGKTENAVSATKLQTARTIGGVAFNGTANINLPGVNTAGNQSTSGNAATATKLQTARTISISGDATGSTSFDGSANANIAIEVVNDSHDHTVLSLLAPYAKNAADLPTSWAMGIQSLFVEASNGYPSFGTVINARSYSAGGGTLQVYTPYGETAGGDTLKIRFGNYNVNNGNSWTEWKDLIHDKNFNRYAPTLNGTGASGNWGINVTGNAATATKLATARTIGGVAFDGTANINLPGVNTAGNQNTSGNAATATSLQTARIINGTSFNGTANITTANWGTARTLSFTGDVTGSASVNGSANVATVMTLANTGVAAGTYKSVTVDTKGRVTSGANVITGLVTSTAATGTTNTATTNTNTFLNIVETIGTTPTTVGTSTQVTGAGTVTVTSDTAGKLTITGSQSITGNAATATKLQTARTIGGVAFDGTANINLPGVNTAGNQSTSGNAATATKLQTARTINGVAFDGTANISITDGTKANLSDFANLKSKTGYQKLPNGLILQWGEVTESISATDYKFFPIAFPNAAHAVIAQINPDTVGGYAASYGTTVGVVDKTKFLFSVGGSFSTGGVGFYMAIGS